MSFYGLTIKCEKVDSSDRSFIHTKLALTYESETRMVDHRQWTTWPDKSVPKTPMASFRLLQYTRKNPSHSTVIHCSAGVGRTGTLLMIEFMYRSLIKGKIPDVVQLTKDARSQRSQAVQTEDQYLYCHYAILQLLHIKKVVPSHFVKHFTREYENYLKLLNDVGGKNLPMQATSLPQPCANCSKIAAHMNDLKPPVESPPSEQKTDKKEKNDGKKGKEEVGSKRDLERKANLLKQLKAQKEEKEKRGKARGTAEQHAGDQAGNEQQQPPPHNSPGDLVIKSFDPNEDVKHTENQCQTQENVNQIQPPQPSFPPPSPPPAQQQPDFQQQQFQASPQCHTPPQTQSPISQTPEQHQQQPQIPQQQQFQAPYNPPAPIQPTPQQQQQFAQPNPFQQQQQPQAFNENCQQGGAQKYQYKPALTYTVQQPGNEKAIVYHRNPNQPFIKAIASPAGTPQPICLVQSNVPPQFQQQQQGQQPPLPPQQNQPGVPFQPQQQF
jgi:hypothetical protein